MLVMRNLHNNAHFMRWEWERVWRDVKENKRIWRWSGHIQEYNKLTLLSVSAFVHFHHRFFFSERVCNRFPKIKWRFRCQQHSWSFDLWRLLDKRWSLPVKSQAHNVSSCLQWGTWQDFLPRTAGLSLKLTRCRQEDQRREELHGREIRQVF